MRGSLLQILTTIIPLAVLGLAMLESLRYPYWTTLLLAVPTSCFLVRLFMIQHDCAHGSFFKSASANDALGYLIGLLTLTPHAYWRRTHALHHATSGNLDQRGYGDIDTLTVQEYLGLPPWRRLAYRIYRHPLVLFGIGPPLHFVIKHRFPAIVPRSWRRERASIHATNLGLLGLLAFMGATIGLGPFLMIQLPVFLIASSIGVWLFYVQHQFEDAYWEEDTRWDYLAAGMRGSSYYKLPKPLQWLTCSIGLHYIHHLNPRIPNYRLQECLDKTPQLQRVKPLTLRQSLKCTSLKLWDDKQQRLVGYGHLKAPASTFHEAPGATAFPVIPDRGDAS